MNAKMYKLLFISIVSILFSQALLFADNENYNDRNVSGRDFSNLSLKNSTWRDANAVRANFTNSNLTSADFFSADLTSANFTDAVITGASFTWVDGFTKEQLYSTASYKNKDLTGVEVDLLLSDLDGLNFSNFNLTSANLASVVKNSNLTNAIITGARFTRYLTKAQLYSTASYKNKDLSGIRFLNLTIDGWNFSNQNLTSADFSSSPISNSDFTNANLTSAVFNSSISNSDFTNAIIKDAKLDHLSLEQLYSTASYKNKDLGAIRISMLNNRTDYDISCADFSGQNLEGSSFNNHSSFNFYMRGVNFKNANLTRVVFSGVYLEGAIFDGADLNSVSFSYFSDDTITARNASFVGADLTDASLNMDFAGSDFTNACLFGAKFYYTTTNFTNAKINGADLSSTVANGFTKEMLYSTKSYTTDRDLSGVRFDYNNISSWDLSGLNLQNVSFLASRITNVNFSNSDLRGAQMLATSGNPIYQNTIMTDGRIENFSMTSASDSLVIRKYEPVSGGNMISAKLDTSSTISGGAILTLERGADFEITNNSTLSVAQGSTISINTDASSSTSFSILAGSGLVFENGAILEINIDNTFRSSDSVSFVVFDWENGGNFEVIGDFVKDESIFLSLNGEKFNGDWNYNIDNNKFIINISQVPEPAAYAAIFGALALFISIRRGKRN